MTMKKNNLSTGIKNWNMSSKYIQMSHRVSCSLHEIEVRVIAEHSLIWHCTHCHFYWRRWSDFPVTSTAQEWRGITETPGRLRFTRIRKGPVAPLRYTYEKKKKSAAFKRPQANSSLLAWGSVVLMVLSGTMESILTGVKSFIWSWFPVHFKQHM